MLKKSVIAGWPSFAVLAKVGVMPSASRFSSWPHPADGWTQLAYWFKEAQLVVPTFTKSVKVGQPPHWLLSRMATLPLSSIGMARSGAPSWLKSPAAIEKPPW